MTSEPTKQDQQEFAQFCVQATDKQLLNIIEKEHKAGRTVYTIIAKTVARGRGLC